MAIIQKTLAEVVTAWENHYIREIAWAYKKAGADRVIAGVVCRSPDGGPWGYEVWDIGA